MRASTHARRMDRKFRAMNMVDTPSHMGEKQDLPHVVMSVTSVRKRERARRAPVACHCSLPVKKSAPKAFYNAQTHTHT